MKDKNEGKTFVEVEDAQKKKRGKNVVIKIPTEALPTGIKKDDLVAGYLVKNNSQKEDEEKGSSKTEESNSKRKMLIKGAMIIPIVVALSLSLKSCVDSAKITEQELITEDKVVSEQFDLTYYSVDFPAEAWALASASGQEEMTNANFIGGNPFYNSEYNANDQVVKEEETTNSINEFNDNKEAVKQSIDVLKDKDSTQEEKKEAIDDLFAASQNIGSIYQEQAPNVEENVKAFEEACNKNPDDRTVNEIATANKIADSFNLNNELAKENIEVLDPIMDKINNGEDIQINSVTIEKDGDIRISGESCKELVTQRLVQKETTGIKAVVQRFKNFFSNLKNKITPEIDNTKDDEIR